MPEIDRIKISELPSALLLDATDETAIVQGGAGSKTTKKVALAVLASFIAEDLQFSSALTTVSKTLIGAINELAQGGGTGGSSTLAGLTDVQIGTNVTTGQILKYNGSKWVNDNESGGASWVDVIGTLSTGTDSVTLLNAAINTGSTIDIYTDVFGVNPTAIALAAGSVTLTFEPQSFDLGVKVRVS